MASRRPRLEIFAGQLIVDVVIPNVEREVFNSKVRIFDVSRQRSDLTNPQSLLHDLGEVLAVAPCMLNRK